MDFFLEEEEYWKCRKHPSVTKTGVCPICLRSRLVLLCADCANVRPCSCRLPSDLPSSSSQSSTSSSFSDTGIGSVGRISFLIENEPAFRRSRSAAFPFLRAKSDDKRPDLQEARRRSLSSSLGSILRAAKKTKKKTDEEKKSTSTAAKTKLLPRSRSVGFSCVSDPGREMKSKGWGWHFSSPIKVFRQQRTSKFLHERSPICRG